MRMSCKVGSWQRVISVISELENLNESHLHTISLNESLRKLYRSSDGISFRTLNELDHMPKVEAEVYAMQSVFMR